MRKRILSVLRMWKMAGNSAMKRQMRLLAAVMLAAVSLMSSAAAADESTDSVGNLVASGKVSYTFDAYDQESVSLFFSDPDTKWKNEYTRYYEVLDDNAKEIYDLLESNYPDNWEYVTYEDGGAEAAVAQVVEEAEYGSFETATEAGEAWVNELGNSGLEAGFAFSYDHPEYFWIRVGGGGYRRYDIFCVDENTYRLEKKIEAFYWLFKPFNTMEAIASYKAKMEESVNKIMAQTSNMTDYEKMAYFDNWLVANNQYNHEAAAATNTGDYMINVSCMPWSTLSGLLPEESPVCEGYSKAFHLLCKQSRIPCIEILGESGIGAHMWNAVRMDGEWYIVDVTWDDGDYPDNNSSNQLYFLTHDISVRVPMNLPAPKIADYDYSPEFFTVQQGKITGSCIGGTYGDMWIALYRSDGKMLNCVKCEKIEPDANRGTTRFSVSEIPFDSEAAYARVFFFQWWDFQPRWNHYRQIDLT